MNFKFTSKLQKKIRSFIIQKFVKMNASNNTLINKFNGMNNKTILHIKEMENLKNYPVLKAAKVKTKYGDSIQVEIEEHVIFLPTRYNSLTEEDISELSSGNYLIKKEVGEDEKSYRLQLERFNMNEFIMTQNGQYPIWN